LGLTSLGTVAIGPLTDSRREVSDTKNGCVKETELARSSLQIQKQIRLQFISHF